ncbi:MAG: hypothetical protein GY859_10410, partial [Desulfobacterales bacterium]|nr:hypothetical protein [Desulfobacterales bacterium]
AEEVINGLKRRPDVPVIGLAPNEIACRRALNADVDEISVPIAGSESFNRSVLGVGIRETLYKTLPAVFQASLENDKPIRVYLLSAFYCQYEGRVPMNALADLVSKLAFMGANEISLVDTPGRANPKQVKETIAVLRDLDLDVNLAAHFHNPHGMGLVNCMAAYEAGVRTFDTAIGGLSGAPFGAPKMEIGSWNVPTEDLVYLFNEIGVSTGYNLDAIVDTVRFAQSLARDELSGHLFKARSAFKSSNFPDPLKLN